MKHKHCRKLLQEEHRLRTIVSPSVTYSPNTLLHSMNDSSTAAMRLFIKPNMHFDSSMALTVLVLLTAFFFMGFICICIRIRSLADDSGSAAQEARRRRQSPPRLYSSSSGSRLGKGLDPSVVRSLPLIPYGGESKHSIDCSICLTEFEERETVKLIPYCRHAFHPMCIDTWLSSHVSCPLCRSKQLFAAGFGEVRLSVLHQDGNDGVTDYEQRTTADDESTWTEVGTFGVRRTSSCSNLRDNVSLQRRTSF